MAALQKRFGVLTGIVALLTVLLCIQLLQLDLEILISPELLSISLQETSFASSSTFCTAWSVDMDDWWLEHPTFTVIHENTTHQCFTKSRWRRQLQALHDVQFTGDCTSASAKLLSGSGWGADVGHVVDGLLSSQTLNVPVVLQAPRDWQYAQGVCASRDWQCYYLPYTSCTSPATSDTDIHFREEWWGFTYSDMVQASLEFATRGQTWLRQAAVNRAEEVDLPSRCVAMHVRRADVVLHGRFSRRYYAIQDYLSAMEEYVVDDLSYAILLLTDDANAIEEALTQHPDRDWYFVERPRHRGHEGGWENQVPSGDARSEVIALDAETRLARQCRILVCSKSNLADYWYAKMLNRGPVQRIAIDADFGHERIYNQENAATVRLSKANW